MGNSTAFCGIGGYEQWGAAQDTHSVDSAGVSEWLSLSHASVSQSSTAFGGIAQNAIDGIADAVFYHGHCTHTLSESNPWWRVDLGIPHQVTRVRVMTREDCCAERLNGLQVWLTERGARRY